MKHLFLFLFLLHLPLQASNVFGDERDADGSEILFIAPLGILPSGGFFPLRVEIKNEGLVEKRWNLNCVSRIDTSYSYSRRGNDDSKISSTFSVACPPKESRTIELLVPMHQNIPSWSDSRYLEVNTEGKGRDSDYHSFHTEPVISDHLAISRDVLTRYQSDLLGSFSVSGSRHGLASCAGPVDVEQLPSDWRAYAGYDALALSRQNYLDLGTGPRAAIDQWVRSGGHLIVLNDGNSAPLPGFEKRKATLGFGFMSLLECGENYDDFSANNFVLTYKRGAAPLVASASNQYTTSSWKVGSELGERSLGTPLLLLALCVFAILVGPVNLFVWANKSRRHRLFVTTPVISIIASLLLVGFIVLKDGFGGDGARAIAIDTGDPGDTVSSVLQEQFSRTGVVLSSDFTFNDEVVFTPVPAPTTDFNRQGSTTSFGVFAGSIRPADEGWKVEGDFFKSRTEQAQVLRAVRPSREKLELVSSPGEPPRIVSSFSYPLTDLFFQDLDDQVWMASSIAPGDTVALTRSSKEVQASQIQPTISRFGKSHQSTLKRLAFRKGSFSALAEDAPGLETLSSIDWQSAPALITGRLIK